MAFSHIIQSAHLLNKWSRKFSVDEKWGENTPSAWSLDFHQTINIRDVYDLPVRQGRVTHQQSGSIQLMFPRLNAYLQTGSDCWFLWWALSAGVTFSIESAAGFKLSTISNGAIHKEKAGRAWKSSVALSNADNSCCDALCKPSCISLSGFGIHPWHEMLTLMPLQQHAALKELWASGSAMTGMGLVGQLVCEEDVVWTSGTRVATVAQCKCKALFGKYITFCRASLPVSSW